MRKLLETKFWDDNSTDDYIHSLLVEHPTGFYVPPSQNCVYFLERDHGLVILRGDFKHATIEYIVTAINVMRSTM